MRGAIENDIIHVNLNQQSVSALLEEKQRFIYRTHLKALSKQEGFQTLILGSPGLFQPRQGFVEFVNMVGILGTFKARGLPHIHFFLYVPIQEGTLHIHLI
jgi:hypothetical protein